MTAREELHESMCGSCSGRFARGECEAVDRAIDAFAHELAKKIRQHHYPRFPGKAEYTQGVDDGYDRAADLIDPESEKT